MPVRKGKETERDILRNALDVFRRVTQMIVDVEAEIPQKDRGLDAIVRLAFPHHEGDWRFGVEVKATLTRTNLGAAIGQLNFYRDHQPIPLGGNLLITRYVTPQMAEELKRNGVQFMDTAGNAYFNQPPLLIFLKGNKPEIDIRAQTVKRAFLPSGLQLIFALLCRPALVEAPYRRIAEAADVALGTVGWVMRDLRETGYLHELGKKGRHLTGKNKLLRQWVEAYPNQLRPRQILGRYTAKEPGWWKVLKDIRAYDAYWGGETAAALVTGYLKPEKVTIYLAEDLDRIILENKLRKDPQGEIEIVKIFWNDVEIPGQYKETVPALLIYADLLATGDPRNIETAKIIYEQDIAGIIRED